MIDAKKETSRALDGDTKSGRGREALWQEGLSERGHEMMGMGEEET